MNKKTLIRAGLFFFIYLLSHLYPLCQSLAASIPVGTIDQTEGVVYLTHEGQKQGIKVKTGDKVYPRDEITTESEGRVKISFINHSSIFLGANSHIIISQILYAPKSSFRKSYLKLPKGKIRAIVEKFSNSDSKFEIETKTAVAGVVGTEEIIFTYVDTETGRDTSRVICREGQVKLRSNDPKITGEVLLDPMEQSWVIAGEPPCGKIGINLEELEQIIQETIPVSGKGSQDRSSEAGQKEKKNKEDKSSEKKDETSRSKDGKGNKEGQQPSQSQTPSQSQSQQPAQGGDQGKSTGQSSSTSEEKPKPSEDQGQGLPRLETDKQIGSDSRDQTSEAGESPGHEQQQGEQEEDQPLEKQENESVEDSTRGRVGSDEPELKGDLEEKGADEGGFSPEPDEPGPDELEPDEPEPDELEPVDLDPIDPDIIKTIEDHIDTGKELEELPTPPEPPR